MKHLKSVEPATDSVNGLRNVEHLGGPLDVQANSPYSEFQLEIDPRLAFLQRASARLTLFECNMVPLREAFDDLVPAFEAIVYRCCPTCSATPCINPSFCEASREADEKPRLINKEPKSRTPQAIIEEILYSVRQGGPEALKEQANINRLSQCDAAALAQIDRRLTKMGAVAA